MIEELTETMGKRTTIAKVNIDEYAAPASECSIPTLILFKNGRVVEQMVGVQQKDPLIPAIEFAPQIRVIYAGLKGTQTH